MTREDVIQQILFYSRLSFDRKLISAMGGNISALLDDKIYITATNTCLGYLKPSDVIICDREGRVLEGNAKPSKETEMHNLVYRLRPEARCVVHLHPPRMTALTLSGKPFPVSLTGPGRNKLFEVPLIPFSLTDDPKLFQDIANAMERMHPKASVFMIAEHGSVAFGPSLHDAFCATDLAEDIAGVALAAGMSHASNG